MLISTLPNMKIFTPYDPISAEKCFDSALQSEGPSYVRLMKGGEPNQNPLSCSDGFDVLEKYGDDFSIFTHGSICSNGLTALKMLKEIGLCGTLCCIWNASNTIKAVSSAQGPIFFLEEQIFPGILGLKYLEANISSKRHHFLGIKRHLDNPLMTREKLLAHHKLSPEEIFSFIQKELN